MNGDPIKWKLDSKKITKKDIKEFLDELKNIKTGNEIITDATAIYYSNENKHVYKWDFKNNIKYLVAVDNRMW